MQAAAHTAHATHIASSPVQVAKTKKKRRLGKGAKARERRERAEAEAEALQRAAEDKQLEYEATKAGLSLQKGDVVVTVPSDRFPVSLELTVSNLVFNPSRGDWMVTFTNDGSDHAWLSNFGRSYHRKKEDKK